jgi:hypothetical protein
MNPLDAKDAVILYAPNELDALRTAFSMALDRYSGKIENKRVLWRTCYLVTTVASDMRSNLAVMFVEKDALLKTRSPTLHVKLRDCIAAPLFNVPI